MNTKAARSLPALLIAITALSGCTFFEEDRTTLAELGYDGETWPDLSGHTVRLIVYDSADWFMQDIADRFKADTGATLEWAVEDDAGAVLQRLIAEKGDPSFDVAYGIDNALLGQARLHNVFESYRPLAATAILDGLDIAPDGYVTAVNHGYIAINVDPAANLTLDGPNDLFDHADQMVTSDPRFSTPGLGFLIATVAMHGEDDAYDYLDYWADLFDAGLTVEQSWSLAYAGHFSAGGAWTDDSNNARDKPIVVSYTTSPAYELYMDDAWYGGATYGGNASRIGDVITWPGSTFHQIQTLGIAKGAKNLAAAQAFIEWSLQEPFQQSSAANEAIYPVTAAYDASEVYGGLDPEPGTFTPAGFDTAELASKLAGWVEAWTDLFEAKTA